MEGFVKLYRQIFEWEWYTDANTSRLFIHLILKANHKTKSFKGNIIECGQTITSINSLTKELDLTPNKIRRSLNNLVSTGEITIEATNKFSLITVCNYTSFHENCGDDNKETTNKPQTKNKQTTTTKNDKNDKNVNNIINISQWKKNYLEDGRLISAVCKNNNVSVDFIEKYMESFIRTQESIGNVEQTTIDYNTHFLNYMRKVKLNVGKKNNRSSYSNDVL